MADARISELNAASTPLDGSELLAVVQGGETKKVEVGDTGFVMSEDVAAIVVVTESEYGDLDPPDPNTFYIVVEDE